MKGPSSSSDIETWVTRIGGASFTVAYEVKDGEQVYARARIVLAAIDKASGRARRLAPDERSWIEAYHEPENPAG